MSPSVSSAPADHGIHIAPWDESLPAGRRIPHVDPPLLCMSAANWVSSSHVVGAVVHPAFSAMSVR